ncbi:MAG: CARDB domain-containing protein [Candidatus Micrarchaeia archaeon]
MDKKAMDLALYGVIVVLAAIAIAEAVHALYPAQYAIQVSMLASPTSNLYPYNTTFFNITLKNEGSSISNLVFGLYVNGTAIKEYKLSIPHGESASIHANYTYAVNGTYSFSAVADSGHLLNIADRKAASSSIVVNVSPSATPNIYTSIPNNDIDNTTSFTFSGQGFHDISALASVYNVSEFGSAFGPASSVLPQIFDTLYAYVAYANGATVSYSNGSIAYVLWLKGTVSPRAIDSMLSTFNLAHSSLNENGSGVSFWKLSNSTSICVFYQQGWTKLIAFDNSSKEGETCAGIAAQRYNPIESSVLVGVLSENKNLSLYQSKFIYTNLTNLGSLLSYSDTGTGAMNLFQNSYGIFAGVIEHAPPISQNTCYGILYNQSNSSICSTYVLPKSGKALPQYGMVNSTLSTPNYTATLYTLTNQSMLLVAHTNAVALLNSLGLRHSIEWVSIFKNTCGFYNSSISCSVNAYNYSTGTASISIKNTLNASMVVNSLSCYMPGAAELPAIINKTVGSGNTIRASVSCESLSLPVISTGEAYTLAMNYTYGKAERVTIGALNITNYGLG